MCIITKIPEILWNCKRSEPMRRAEQRLYRDIHMVLRPKAQAQPVKLTVCLEEALQAEQYSICAEEEEIKVTAGDELGVIYAFLHMSERFMGIPPFWYWNDSVPVKRDAIVIPCGSYASAKYGVRFRGWFINDEVLLDVWHVPESWEMAFEALLRLGGNTVIPGTDGNSKRFKKLASDMGLYITHHHAEPLGAEMFLRAYPDKNPSFAEHPELFRGLWKEAIESQKGQKTIWNVGFRGQGDRPFWADDPQYDTPEKRGGLISSLIKEQYAMVKSEDQNAICCTNLYGETMELYRQGMIALPEDVIYVWADNGYGKMVSRRQGSHNPRVPALPEKGMGGRHGIYYHASFYDLQAAFHITMLPGSPAWVEEQLKEAYALGADELLIVNASNIRPHSYTLHKIAQTWGYCGDYMEQYYGSSAPKAEELFAQYYRSMLSYGHHQDEKAGEQFYHYTMRAICHGILASGAWDTEADLVWLTGEVPLQEQVRIISQLLQKGNAGLKQLEEQCSEARKDMPKCFSDILYVQAVIHAKSCAAELLLCQAYELLTQREYEKAFEAAGDACADIQYILHAMAESEHGKWRDFYANECLTDIKFTLYSIKGVMQYIRNLGDGPHFYTWARKFMGDKKEEKIVLITNMRNHPGDDEIYRAMKKPLMRRNERKDDICRADI